MHPAIQHSLQLLCIRRFCGAQAAISLFDLDLLGHQLLFEDIVLVFIFVIKLDLLLLCKRRNGWLELGGGCATDHGLIGWRKLPIAISGLLLTQNLICGIAEAAILAEFRKRELFLLQKCASRLPIIGTRLRVLNIFVWIIRQPGAVQERFICVV